MLQHVLRCSVLYFELKISIRFDTRKYQSVFFFNVCLTHGADCMNNLFVLFFPPPIRRHVNLVSQADINDSALDRKERQATV